MASILRNFAALWCFEDDIFQQWLISNGFTPFKLIGLALWATDDSSNYNLIMQDVLVEIRPRISVSLSFFKFLWWSTMWGLSKRLKGSPSRCKSCGQSALKCGRTNKRHWTNSHFSFVNVQHRGSNNRSVFPHSVAHVYRNPNWINQLVEYQWELISTKMLWMGVQTTIKVSS